MRREECDVWLLTEVSTAFASDMQSRRVYPCDACDGWHLTSKRLSGKMAPWDLDPDWSRPTPRTGDPS